MYEFFQELTNVVLPVFVLSTMLNVGLTQKPANILENLKNWHFLVRMVIANFLIVPALMIALVYVTDFDPALQAGLLVLSVCAGAPFLIKLTQTSQNDIALGATVMMVLVIATVGIAPILLPIVIEGVEVDALAVARSLFRQLLLPVIVGMLIAQFLTSVRDLIQPWVARIGNYALYIVLGATLVGYWPNIRDIFGEGAFLGGLAVLLMAFFIGYLMGDGKDHLQDVGGLGTAQRNTAASMIIATANFTDPNVFVVISIVNTLGIIMLLAIATALSKDKKGNPGSLLVDPKDMRSGVAAPHRA